LHIFHIGLLIVLPSISELIKRIALTGDRNLTIDLTGDENSTVGYKNLPTCAEMFSNRDDSNRDDCCFSTLLEQRPLDISVVSSMSPPLFVVAADPMVADPMVAVVADPMVIDLQPQRLAERLADLTNEQLDRVTAALLHPHDEALLMEKFGIPVTRRICKCLNPRLWLNDEIINYYMQMLQEWDKRLCEADPTRKPSHFFNLFFMSKLLQNNKYTYANVKR
jgi:hypothetical protein